MASPNTRTALKNFCLRRLGEPVIEVNIDPDQIEDCIDDAIQFFREFHQDGTYRGYVVQSLSDSDVTNQYIDLPSNVHYVVRVLPFSENSIGGGSGPWSLKYQIAASDLWNAGSSYFSDIQYYEQLGQYMNTLDMILNGSPLIEYQRHGDRLYIHGEWWDQELKSADYIAIEAYRIIDPETNTSIYNDMFIKNYTTALIKQRWGQNMSKFEGMQLPGGVTISGERILAEATAEIERLEEKVRLEYEPGPDFFVG